MRATGWVSLQQLVAGDQTLSALRQETLWPNSTNLRALPRVIRSV